MASELTKEDLAEMEALGRTAKASGFVRVEVNVDIMIEVIARASEVERLRETLVEAEAFIGAMFGRGPDAVIPETVTLPLGVPCKLGEIMRDIRAALAKQEPTRDGK